MVIVLNLYKLNFLPFNPDLFCLNIIGCPINIDKYMNIEADIGDIIKNITNAKAKFKK